jgi:hypothetical protein
MIPNRGIREVTARNQAEITEILGRYHTTAEEIPNPSLHIDSIQIGLATKLELSPKLNVSEECDDDDDY